MLFIKLLDSLLRSYNSMGVQLRDSKTLHNSAISALMSKNFLIDCKTPICKQSEEQKVFKKNLIGRK